MAEDVFGIVDTLVAATYQVDSVVAEGDFGVLYRAQHAGTRAPVALRLLKLPAQNPQQQAAFLQLFRAQAELLTELSASLPSVLRVLHADAFISKDGRFVPYLVLEWLNGMTLEALLAERNRARLTPIPLRKWLRLLTPVARALERAQDFTGPHGPVSIVHLDLKPANIFIAQVAGEEVVKILGIGMAPVKSAARQSAARISPNGIALAFTPAYGAPEQWAPLQYGQSGPWTDVWGLALCLVQAMLGRSVIEGEPEAIRACALDPLRRPTPRSEGIDLPDAIEAVFARALSLEPRARQRHAGLFWDELMAAFDQPETIAEARALELAEDLEFDPTSVRRPTAAAARVSAPYGISLAAATRGQASSRPPSAAPVAPVAANARMRAAAASVPHFVPDLELAPPSVSRRPSGEQAVVSPQSQPRPAEVSVLDLDDAVLPASLALDLDLPADEARPQRSVSSQSFVAVTSTGQPNAPRSSSPPTRSHSGSLAAVREPQPGLAVIGVGSTRPPAADVSGPFEAGFVARIEPKLLEERSLLQRLRLAIALLGAAILIATVDPIYAATTGEVLQIAGCRLSLLAGGLLLVALGLAAREMTREP